MMNLRFFPFLTAILFAISHSSVAMEQQLGGQPETSSKPQKIIKPGKVSKITNYDTYITCEYFGDTTSLTQAQFYIFRTQDKQNIGEILLQYYPEGGYYKTAGDSPTLRLRHIEIKADFRRQHHATRALETLFIELRKSPHFPQPIKVWLEYSSYSPYLAAFYGRFGFQETSEPSFAETKVLSVPLQSIKFPYYKRTLKK